MRALLQCDVVKRELSWKEKLYSSIFVPTRPTVTDLGSDQLSLADRGRSRDNRSSALKRCQLRWFGYFISMPPGCLPLKVFRARPTGRRLLGQTQKTLEGLYLIRYRGKMWDGGIYVWVSSEGNHRAAQTCERLGHQAKPKLCDAHLLFENTQWFYVFLP